MYLCSLMLFIPPLFCGTLILPFLMHASSPSHCLSVGWDDEAEGVWPAGHAHMHTQTCTHSTQTQSHMHTHMHTYMHTCTHTYSSCPPPSSFLKTEGLKLESAEMLSFHFLLTSVDNTNRFRTHTVYLRSLWCLWWDERTGLVWCCEQLI